MKRIIPAVLLLLIAFTLVCSSTYAWFSMSLQVVMHDMQITVVGGGGLEIAETIDGTYGKSTEFSSVALSMPPCSTVPRVEPVFYKRLTAGEEMTADSSAYDASTTFEVAEINNDYIKKTLYLKVDGEYDGDNLRASIIKRDGGVQVFDSSLRVMMIFTNTETDETEIRVYAPFGNPTAARGIASINDAGRPNLSAGNVNITPNGSMIIPLMPKKVPFSVDVYVWYEGQDASCTKNNVKNGTYETDFSLQFDVDDFYQKLKLGKESGKADDN